MNKSSVKRFLITSAALASVPLFCGIEASADQTNQQAPQPYNVLNRAVDAHNVNDGQQTSPHSPIVSFDSPKTYPLYHFNSNNFRFVLDDTKKSSKAATGQQKRYGITKRSAYHTAHIIRSKRYHTLHRGLHPAIKLRRHVNIDLSAPRAMNLDSKKIAAKPLSNEKRTVQPDPSRLQSNLRPSRNVTPSVKLGSDNGTHVRHFRHMFKIAKSKLGDPYVWGGIGENSFDCSGFTQYVYSHGAHRVLPRTAQGQYDYTKRVDEAHAKSGDLVFFGYGPRAIEHVGLYLGHGKMIDAQLRGVIIEHIHRPWWNLVGFGHYIK